MSVLKTLVEQLEDSKRELELRKEGDFAQMDQLKAKAASERQQRAIAEEALDSERMDQKELLEQIRHDFEEQISVYLH